MRTKEREKDKWGSGIQHNFIARTIVSFALIISNRKMHSKSKAELFYSKFIN